MTQSGLLRRIRLILGCFTVALLFSGLTAIPLRWELALLDKLAGVTSAINSMWPSLARWISIVRGGLDATYTAFPFMAYGTDWLAFGHVVIAITFLGPIRDPVRNIWVIDVGIIACSILVPYAILLGPVRGIPPFWTLVDSMFGLLGIIPLLVARRWTAKLASLPQPTPQGP